MSVADIWLHLTTSTALFTRVSPTTVQPDYSFGIVPECLKTNNSVAAQNPLSFNSPAVCSITYWGLRNSTISLQVMSNISDDATVYTYTDPHGKPFTYLGVPEHTSLFKRDFTARTYGANTQCQLISKKCKLHSDAAFLSFNCSSAFKANNNGQNFESAFFMDKSMKKQAIGTQNYGAGNPYYFAVYSGESVNSTAVPNSPEFVESLHGIQGYVLGCNTTIYDIEYDRVNNSITRFVPSVSNTSVSNIWQTSISYNKDWVHNIKQATKTAIFSPTGPEFANKVALAFSKVTLALGAQGVGPRPALAAQDRRTILAARIPKAPLVTLVVFSLLYALCGLMLTVLAVRATRHKIPDLQAGLSIAGLVADRFEEPSSRCKPGCVEDMFQEYSGKEDKRVGIESTDEDRMYRYITLKKEQSLM